MTFGSSCISCLIADTSSVPKIDVEVHDCVIIIYNHYYWPLIDYFAG
jgi:hypothetical protein